MPAAPLPEVPVLSLDEPLPVIPLVPVEPVLPVLPLPRLSVLPVVPVTPELPVSLPLVPVGAGTHSTDEPLVAPLVPVVVSPAVPTLAAELDTPASLLPLPVAPKVPVAPPAPVALDVVVESPLVLPPEPMLWPSAPPVEVSPAEPELPVVLLEVDGTMPGGQSLAEAPLESGLLEVPVVPVLLLGSVVSLELPMPLAPLAPLAPVAPEVAGSLEPDVVPEVPDVASVAPPMVLPDVLPEAEPVSCEMMLESVAPLVPLAPLVESAPAAKARPELAIKARK